MNIIISTVIISFVLALVLGCLLGFFKKVFAVQEDERIGKLIEILPNANCGGCGYAGCAAYAAALVNDGAACNGCTAGGASVTAKVAEIMGGTADDTSYIAVLACQGCNENAVKKGEYTGLKSCAAANIAINGTKLCASGCIGYGDCVAACKFDAIRLDENGIPVINREKCTGCGACAKACPKKIIKKVNAKRTAPMVLCSVTSDNKPAVLKNCKVSCIKCHKCEKDCPQGAIHFENNLPVHDEAKCVGCGTCINSCVRKSIQFVTK